MKNLLTRLLIICLFATIIGNTYAQESNLYVSATTLQKRATLYQNLTRNINKDLSFSLSNSNEEKWQDAFASLELLQIKSPLIDKRIKDAFDSINQTSEDFKRALIQLGYANYPGENKTSMRRLLDSTSDTEIFSYAAEYYIQNDQRKVVETKAILNRRFLSIANSNTILNRLNVHFEQLLSENKLKNKEILGELFNKNFLPGHTIVYSIQRENRDYPGMVIIRKADGYFLKDSTGNIYSVAQLARSITGMPYFLRYGNTPQGIYKINGFGVSLSSFIGPSPNVQLQMPVEISPQKFLNDSTINDSIWDLSIYRKLLPGRLKNSDALYETYYAGLGGRNEIICHGSTINPDYYYGKPYFPHTPSEGCLTTSENWNGRRLKSNQQLLINGLLLAGGATGYCVVINIDNQLKPVTPDEIATIISELEKQ